MSSEIALILHFSAYKESKRTSLNCETLHPSSDIAGRRVRQWCNQKLKVVVHIQSNSLKATSYDTTAIKNLDLGEANISAGDRRGLMSLTYKNIGV